jgi:hypothetical protein
LRVATIILYKNNSLKPVPRFHWLAEIKTPLSSYTLNSAVLVRSSWFNASKSILLILFSNSISKPLKLLSIYLILYHSVI